MGQVIELSTGKPRPITQDDLKRAQQMQSVYECSRCHAKDQLFKLHSDGKISCGDCGVQMSNLTTIYTKGAA